MAKVIECSVVSNSVASAGIKRDDWSRVGDSIMLFTIASEHLLAHFQFPPLRIIFKIHIFTTAAIDHQILP